MDASGLHCIQSLASNLMLINRDFCKRIESQEEQTMRASTRVFLVVSALLVCTIGVGTIETDAAPEKEIQRDPETGDANGDGSINGGDVGFLIEYLFYGGPAPNPIESADVNCDGFVNIDDAMGLAGSIAQGGPPPGDPDGDGVPDC